MSNYNATYKGNKNVPNSRNKSNEIINALEQFEGLTINQLGHMFFPSNEYNYYYARNKLKLMQNKGLINAYRDIDKNKKIYFIGNKLPDISMHRMVLMDFYSYLVYSGCEIKDYKFEYRWLDGKYRSDGIFFIEFNEVMQIIVVEVDFTHKTDLKKYEFLYESRECQNKFGTFPTIFIINSKGNKYEYKFNVEEVEDYIYYLDFKFKEFSRVIALLS